MADEGSGDESLLREAIKIPLDSQHLPDTTSESV